MSNGQCQLVWNLFVELRKEILESQKIRAQVIGFKITFVSAASGLIASHPDKIPGILFVIPAFAAIFFDLLITGYSFSIKRIGYYCLNHLEPRMRRCSHLPQAFQLWQQFVAAPERRQSFSFIANLGITSLTMVPALVGVWYSSYHWILKGFLFATLVGFFVYDIRAFLLPGRFQS